MKEFLGKKIPESLEELVEPKGTALLVWDVQYDIAQRAFNYQELIANLRELLPVARAAGVTIIYTQQTAYQLSEECPAWIRQRMRMSGVDDPAKVPLRTIEGTRGWEVIDEVKPQPGDIVVKKRRPTAFIGTEMDMLLRNRGLSTVVLTGVSTEMGVEHTARDGLALGYFMVIVRDCVGSSSREGHEQALKYMERTFDVTNSRNLIEIWGRRG